MLNVRTRAREQRELDDLMRALGFTVAIAPDTTTRPIRPAWYQGVLHGRPAAVTMASRNVSIPGSWTDGGNSNAVQIVVSVILGAVDVGPVGYGIHTAFGELPDPDPADLVTPQHPAANLMPPSVRTAFHRFARGRAAPSDVGRSPHARYLRITDRAKLDSYLPPVILNAVAVLVMHELPMETGWQALFVPNTNDMGWVAHALESHAHPQRS